LKESAKNQTEIALDSGLTSAYLSDLKLGKRTNPSIAKVEAIASALGVSVSWLYAGEGEMKPEPVPTPKPDPQRDLTLALARARTERYGQAAAQALEETLEDLRDHLEMLAASGPAVSPAAVQACKDRIDAFVQELTRQREADTQIQ
jgi:transcriptional regulator with XRE-family HTH domain